MSITKIEIPSIDFLFPKGSGLTLDFETALRGEEFWGKNIEFVGAIVGANGSGKTTILEEIAQNKDLSHQIVFYSPFLRQPNFAKIILGLPLLVDLSKHSVMERDTKYARVCSFAGCHGEHKAKNTERLIDFMHFNETEEIIGKNVDLPIFKEIKIIATFPEDTSLFFSDIPRDFRAFLDNYTEIESRSSASTPKEKFLNNFYVAIIKKVKATLITGGNDLGEGELENAEDYFEEVESLEKALFYFFKHAKFIDEPSFQLPITQLKQLIKLIKEKEPLEEDTTSFYASFREAKNILQVYKEFNTKLADLFPYKDNGSFLHFSPSVKFSSGEQTMYDLFSLFQNSKTTITKPHSMPLLILLDEPDLDFHPMWKKKFIKTLLTTVPKIFRGRKISIIFSTHDPITLSDIPRANIIALEKEGRFTTISKNISRTFAANVNDLLSDSFFINDGLIGEFAIDKINETINWINENQSKDKRKSDFPEKKAFYKKVIEIIDEPILQLKLAEMLDELSREAKSFKNKLIEKEIKRLKKMKK